MLYASSTILFLHVQQTEGCKDGSGIIVGHQLAVSCGLVPVGICSAPLQPSVGRPHQPSSRVSHPMVSSQCTSRWAACRPSRTVYCLCTACVLPVYCLCTACVLPVYCLCTACVLPVYCLLPAGCCLPAAAAACPHGAVGGWRGCYVRQLVLSSSGTPMSRGMSMFSVTPGEAQLGCSARQAADRQWMTSSNVLLPHECSRQPLWGNTQKFEHQRRALKVPTR
jgi:hypothetical protein